MLSRWCNPTGTSTCMAALFTVMVIILSDAGTPKVVAATAFQPSYNSVQQQRSAVSTASDFGSLSGSTALHGENIDSHSKCHGTKKKCTGSSTHLRNHPFALRKKSGGSEASHTLPLFSSLDVTGGGEENENKATKTLGQRIKKLNEFLEKNFFLLGMVVAVSLARLLPSLGKNGGILRPERFIGNYGVTLIFLLSGLSLELSELKQAAANFKLNFAVQAVTFGAWPFLVGLPLTKALRLAGTLLPSALIDGLLILTCLPTTVNMCIVLTSAAGGNVASALCNAVIGNMAGIFLTPALLLRFFGTQIHLPFTDMVFKLCNKVLVPVAIGQALRATRAKDIYTIHSKKFKRLQEFILLGIVWNAFCNAFSGGFGLEIKHGLALLAIIPALHLGTMAVLWKLFELPFWKFNRSQVVAAMFCGSHKTLAFGLPLINTIFEGNPNLAAYCAPLMFVHPLQLVLGSLLVPKLTRYIENDEVSS